MDYNRKQKESFTVGAFLLSRLIWTQRCRRVGGVISETFATVMKYLKLIVELVDILSQPKMAIGIVNDLNKREQKTSKGKAVKNMKQGYSHVLMNVGELSSMSFISAHKNVTDAKKAAATYIEECGPEYPTMIAVLHLNTGLYEELKCHKEVKVQIGG